MERYLDSNPKLEPKVNVHEEPGLELDLEILHELITNQLEPIFLFGAKFHFFFNPK
jgi:hypothetical protein